MSEKHCCDRCKEQVDCLVGFNDHSYCIVCFEIELNGTGEPLKRLREMIRPASQVEERKAE